MEINERILSTKQVEKITQCSRVHIWRLQKEGKFPKRRLLGKAKIGWLASEIEEWLKNRPQADDGGNADE